MYTGIFLTTLDGVILDCNESFARILGYASKEEVLTHAASDFYFDAAQRKSFVEQIQKEINIATREVCLRGKNEKRVWVMESISLINANNGAQPLFQGTIIEFAARRTTEDELRSQKELMQAVFDYAPFMIGCFSKDGQIETINRTLEFEISGIKGTKRWLEMHSTPLRNKNHQIIAALGVTRDVTERKKAEEALLAANQSLAKTFSELQFKNQELASMTQQLWQASKLATMGELAASIAHELNNPLATVGLLTESLIAQLANNQPGRESLSVILKEIDRMATLVSNLLHFSRRSQRQVSTIDLREEVANSVEFVHYHLRGHNVEVIRDFVDPLPTIQADRQQLRQLFLNLLTNASDAMPKGGKLTVRASRSELNDAEAVLLEFVDTGEGIRPENLEKLWEPFFTTKPEGKGTGLGLAICRRIVAEHGGTISIDSKRGLGTTVSMLFPATGPESLS